MLSSRRPIAQKHCRGRAAVLTALVLCLICGVTSVPAATFSPLLVVNTWPWVNATGTAFATLVQGRTAVDAVEAGCTAWCVRVFMCVCLCKTRGMVGGARRLCAHWIGPEVCG